MGFAPSNPTRAEPWTSVCLEVSMKRGPTRVLMTVRVGPLFIETSIDRVPRALPLVGSKGEALALLSSAPARSVWSCRAEGAEEAAYFHLEFGGVGFDAAGVGGDFGGLRSCCADFV